MINRKDNNIMYETPFFQNLLEKIDKTIYYLFLNPISLIIFDFIWISLFIIIVTGELRFYINNIFIEIVLFILLFILLYVWGFFLIKKILSWLIRLVYGEPIFGKLGGMDRKSFFTHLKISDAITFKVHDDDIKTVKDFNKLNYDITEEYLKNNYRKYVYKSSDSKNSEDFERNWSKYWKEKILKYSTAEGLSYKDALSEDKISSRIIPVLMENVIYSVAPFIKLFQLIMIYLIFNLINKTTEFLTVVQVGIILCLIISIVWFIHCVNQIRVLHLGKNFQQLPAEIQEKFSKKMKPFLGKIILVKEIVVKDRYYSLWRNYEARQLSLVVFLNTFTILVTVAIILIISALLGSSNFENILSWYKNFLIGVIILPFAFIIGFYLTSMIIQRSRQILTPIFLGLLTGLLPYAFNYLITGRLEISETQNVVNSSISGLSVFIISTVMLEIKKVIKKEPSS